MKKAIIFTFALSLFALPMSLHANPPAKDDAVKPLSAMKSTIASPSETPAKTEDTAESAEKAGDEKKGDAKKTDSDAKNDDAKK